MGTTKGASGSGEAFDLRRIKRLVELMDEYGLSEVDLRQGEMQVRLLRSVPAPGPVPSEGMPGASGAGHSGAAAGAAPSGEALGAAPKEGDEGLVAIESPMVGTFYLASSPDAEPYVQVGSEVGPQTTVCIIEAMKVFNEIPAEVTGTIVEVLVSNGEPVEFGQPLFRVRPSS